ncbi:MAG: hypothetical protein JW849_04145 [Phycisphaerae bacterium]|nr:hypothetical protein [Phycisphaerae bacterium]
MATKKAAKLVLDHKFDAETCRHYLNKQLVVLHCHHYASLYTQLAMDCSMLDAKQLLAECSEDTFLEVLTAYFREKNVTSLEDRIAIGEQYFASTGLGKLTVQCAGADSGEVRLDFSHVDQGWIRKWEKTDQPVNFIGLGYVSALFAAVFDLPARSFRARETESIVMGCDHSTLEVVRN